MRPDGSCFIRVYVLLVRTYALLPDVVAIKQESIATKKALDNVAKHVSMALYMRISVEVTVVTIVYVYQVYKEDMKHRQTISRPSFASSILPSLHSTGLVFSVFTHSTIHLSRLH